MLVIKKALMIDVPIMPYRISGAPPWPRPRTIVEFIATGSE
jgi:hypothetical protein